MPGPQGRVLGVQVDAVLGRRPVVQCLATPRDVATELVVVLHVAHVEPGPDLQPVSGGVVVVGAQAQEPGAGCMPSSARGADGVPGPQGGVLGVQVDAVLERRPVAQCLATPRDVATELVVVLHVARVEPGPDFQPVSGGVVVVGAQAQEPGAGCMPSGMAGHVTGGLDGRGGQDD